MAGITEVKVLRETAEQRDADRARMQARCRHLRSQGLSWAVISQRMGKPVMTVKAWAETEVG